MSLVKELAAQIAFGHKGSERRYVNWLRRRGVRVGENVHLYTPWSIKIDTSRPWLVEIGDNVHITADCSILTHDYSWAVIRQITGEVLGASGKVRIGNNVFIGQKTIVLRGSSIGDNVIVGAGSVVNGRLEGDAVYAGVPAKKIADMGDFIAKRRERLLDEAVELVLEYEGVYDSAPDAEQLNEFFWLFEPRILEEEEEGGGLPAPYLKQLRTDGCFSLSKEAFLNSSPKFRNFSSFLDYCHGRRHDAVKGSGGMRC